MVGVLCYDCGALNAGSTKFCIECGTRMAVRDDRVACAACNSPNGAGAKFCVECGTRMAVRDEGASCPVCNSLNAAGAKFCVECGAALARIDGRPAVTCPRCRSINAGGAKFCVECGAGLVTGGASSARPIGGLETVSGPFSEWTLKWREQANLPEESLRLAIALLIFALALAAYALAPSTAMLALIYVVTSALAGFALVQQFLPHLPRLVRLCGGYLAGIVLTAWTTFLPALALSPPTVSSNTWGDTGLHVSLARSFSEGHNYPPEYPFYGGEPIRYHFGYDFFAGALEDAGLPIRLAFNLPGALGFTALILLVFELARWLFRNVAVGLMAVVLLITNSSFVFLRYFQLYNVSSVFELAGISKAV